MAVVIRHRLDLLLRLIDTVTGYPVTVLGGDFFRDGAPLRPIPKEEGNRVLLDAGREDFLLTVRIPGYEEQEILVRYADLSPELPTVELDLIPRTESLGNINVHTLRGKIPGLVSLDAVRCAESVCQVRGYDRRTNALTLFNPNRVELDQLRYALVNPREKCFEPLKIARRVSCGEYFLSAKPEKEPAAGLPVCRMVVGAVKNGAYLLRVGGPREEWLVRATADGQNKFYTVDFREPQPALRAADDSGIEKKEPTVSEN